MVEAIDNENTTSSLNAATALETDPYQEEEVKVMPKKNK